MMALTACEQVQLPADDATNSSETEATTGKTRKFTFTCKGDFDIEFGEMGATTRGYLQADGKDLTHLWVMDYMATICSSSWCNQTIQPMISESPPCN